MGMTEFSSGESDAIIEAAANGTVTSEHGAIGEMLAGLHAPGAASSPAPQLTLASHRVTGRIARRTAVAATAAVLGLASVAAAATGTVTLLDSPDPEFAETFDTAAEDDEGSPEDDSAVAGGEDEHDEGETVGDDADADDVDKSDREIEGVDPSDGLDTEELELACEGALNHGHYVSLVARDKITEVDGTHGDRVSEAAGTDCGKSDDDDADDDGEESTGTDDDGDDDDAAEGNGNGNGHAKGKGNGHSNGNGNGNGHDRD